MGETIPGRKGNGKNGRLGWLRRWHGFPFETRHVSDFRKSHNKPGGPNYG